MAGLRDHLSSSVGHWGYLAIFVLMALESACIPIPSEVTMPVGGALAATGHLELWLVGLVGALGNLVGSWLAYGIGATGGRTVVLRFGRFVRLRARDLDRAETWFTDHGPGAVFWSRLLPVVRTFISLPAGIGRMRLSRFTIYTLLGCLPWSYGLAVGGYLLGQNWQKLSHNVELVAYAIVALAVAGVLAWLLRRGRRSGSEEVADSPRQDANSTEG